MFAKVEEIVREQLGLDDSVVITRESSLVGDLEADSLDAVQVVMEIEDAFGVEIPDSVAEGFKNIGDIVDYVEKNK